MLTTPAIVNRVHLYVRQLETEEWRAQHDVVGLWHEFVGTLRFGFFVYEQLRELEDLLWGKWMENLQATQGPALRASIRNSVREWLQPCEVAEQSIGFFASQGHPVPEEDVSKFRRYCAEARWMLTPGGEAFGGEPFVKAADSAIAEHRAGKTEPM
jgi:hypothetical protein